MADDRVMLITGASSGIGEATARAAAEAGYRLVLAARSAGKLEELAGELGGEERALAAACDVTEWDDQEALAEAALRAFGRIDVVFANAGFGARAGFLAESPERWRSMLLTNVLGPALTLRATLPALRESVGHIVLTGSVAGRIGIAGSLYSASKWAVTAMGEAARLELDGSGVRVTVIEPGYTQSPFWDSDLTIEALTVHDVARAIMYAIGQPPHVDVNEILIRPVAQKP